MNARYVVRVDLVYKDTFVSFYVCNLYLGFDRTACWEIDGRNEIPYLYRPAQATDNNRRSRIGVRRLWFDFNE